MILQKSPHTVACSSCGAHSHTVQFHTQCDGHSPCPGYGTTETCPPLIVLAVHEWMAPPALPGR